MLRPDEIQSIRVSFATSRSIRDRSFGAVTEPATSDAETGDPVPGGLFCPVIFGEPEAESCVCGKLSGPDAVGQVCPDCRATAGRAVAYRRRCAHIDLAAPVLHPWLLHQEPHPVARLLGLAPEDVVAVAHYESGLAVDDRKREGAARVTLDASPGALTGPAGIRQALSRVRLEVLASDDDEESRLLLRSLRQSGTQPADLVLDAVPVMPAGLRPRSLMQDGVAVTVEANDLYLTVLQRNRRLAGAIADGLPDALRRDLSRSLQEAVEALLDSGGDRRRAPTGSPSGRTSFRSLEDAVEALLDDGDRSRSLATLLRGKEGIFGRNLLGKRLDYSGRSVIIPAPELSLEQVGLPLEMALELFRPHVMAELLRSRQARTLMAARRLVAEQSPAAVAALLEVSSDHPVLLNRAPTLHRLGLQAFYPRIIAGNAIALHPLTCCAFNADFDGDQMAVHVPLTPEAIEEARTRLLGPLNIFSPGTGEPLAGPTQDMVAGWAYATRDPHPQAEVILAASLQEARDRALAGALELDAPVHIPCAGETVHTTAGRAVLNALLPESLRVVNEPADKRLLTDLVRRCRDVEGTEATIQLVNELHRVGFSLVTRSGLSVSWADYPQVPSTEAIARQARGDEAKAGTDEERRAAWLSAMDELQQEVEQAFATDSEGQNPVHLMVSSGARGNRNMLRRSAGMLGPLAPVGYSEKALEVVDRGYIEGLSPLQREAQVKTVRWSLATTMYRSTTCGVLGRRLVNACVDIIVTAADCGTGRGVEVPAQMARGRLLAQDVAGPDGRLLASAGTVTDETLIRDGIDGVLVRSPLTCETVGGVCAACWGTSPETGRGVDPGTAVGVAAAQALMEAAAQLTFRTFFGPAGKPPHSAAPVGLLRLVALTEAKGLGIGDDGESWLPVAEALQELGEEGLGPALAADMRRVFAKQGVALDPRHFELIARALLSRVKVIDPGDSDLLTDETVARDRARELMNALRAEGKRPPRVAVTVTAASELGQVGDSFLAAAGYGNPARVLTRAALRAAEDDLSGIRERLIVGKLIPVGTGWTAEMPGANGDS